jgi:aryl-alcohol dehydrogenase-like predicted oxidoreductase
VVAQALSDYGGERPYVFTKCSLRWDGDRKVFNSLKADSIRGEVEASLSRLKVDVIDLYQVHWPNPDPEIEEGWTALAELQQEGKLRYIGVSNFDVEQMKRAQAIAPVTSLQPPYHLLSRRIEAEILPFCKDNNVGVIVYSPMASGLLTGSMTRERIQALPDNDWRRNSSEYQEPKLTRNLALVDLLKEIGADHNATAGEVAIAWTLSHAAVTAAIVGLRKPGQAAGVLAAADLHLSEAETQRIEGFLAV